MSAPASERPRVLVSACLLGAGVRFDGGHRRDPFIVGALAPFVEWVPICPEVELGLGVPRPSLRLVAAAGGARLVASRSGEDLTAAMARYACAKADALAGAALDGCILKSKSPSCGPSRVRVYSEEAAPSRTGVGLFAAALRDRLGGVPITEDGWLHDAGLRDVFLAQLFTHARLRDALASDASPRALLEAHARHKLLYMAHSPDRQHALGRLLARAGVDRWDELEPKYRAAAMGALAVPTSRGKQANVLEHILGYFKKALAARDKREILVAIDDVRAGVHEPAVPRALLAHQLRHHGRGDWLERQVYWEPYPRAIAGLGRAA